MYVGSKLLNLENVPQQRNKIQLLCCFSSGNYCTLICSNTEISRPEKKQKHSPSKVISSAHVKENKPFS